MNTTTMTPATRAQSHTRRRFAELGGRGLLALVFLTAGGMKLAATDFEVHGFTGFGYPMWFMYLVGALMVGAAVALLCKRLASGGALVLAVLMVGAVVSHLRAGDALVMALPAAVLVALLLGVAWVRRDDAKPR